MQNLQTLLKQIDILQEKQSSFPSSKALEKKLYEDFRLNYTYDSNAIEGNTLSLIETKVVLEGITVGGKTLKEHFEAINHAEAIDYIKGLVKDNEILSEYQIKSIHALILKNIDNDNAGNYRSVDVVISGAKHKPPSFISVASQMQDFITWYQKEALNLHPVLRASKVHVDFVGIHPFIDGNGRTARLLMNLELLKANLLAINIKHTNKLEYYKALDKAHCTKNYDDFYLLVASYVLQSLKDRIKMYENPFLSS